MVVCRQRTHDEVCEVFNNKYQDRTPISRGTVSKIIQKFDAFDNVKDRPRSGRPAILDDTKMDVFLSVVEDPHKPTRVVSQEIQVCQRTVCKYLRKEKWHPYKVKLVQELREDDSDRRIQFCEIMLERFNREPNFYNCIIFSDEATFYLNGTVNRQNCRYWSNQNPHWMMESQTQRPQKLNVWAAIINNQIIGPYFFEATLTGAAYLEFLELDLIPELARRFPNQQNQRLFFQQDGAPPHFLRAVRDFLNTVFPNRWIGRRGAIEWPPRSPDLTPLDYFLWGYLKSKVYINRPNNLQDLKDRITAEIAHISQQTIRKVIEEFSFRIEYCLQVNGEHFEHLI